LKDTRPEIRLDVAKVVALRRYSKSSKLQNANPRDLLSISTQPLRLYTRCQAPSDPQGHDKCELELPAPSFKTGTLSSTPPASSSYTHPSSKLYNTASQNAPPPAPTLNRNLDPFRRHATRLLRHCQHPTPLPLSPPPKRPVRVRQPASQAQPPNSTAQRDIQPGRGKPAKFEHRQRRRRRSDAVPGARGGGAAAGEAGPGREGVPSPEAKGRVGPGAWV